MDTFSFIKKHIPLTTPGTNCAKVSLQILTVKWGVYAKQTLSIIRIYRSAREDVLDNGRLLM